MARVKFPTWKTITLGLHQDSAAYLAALQAGGYDVGEHASTILAKTPIATTKTVVNLVRITVRELGFRKAAKTKQIYVAALTRGLSKCPAEVGPALRLAYADQPSEMILVGMEPSVDSDGRLSVFYVARSGSLRWLRTHYWTSPADKWGPEYMWVFLSSKQ